MSTDWQGSKFVFLYFLISVYLQTVRFKNELERNITIKLGYANAKVGYTCAIVPGSKDVGPLKQLEVWANETGTVHSIVVFPVHVPSWLQGIRLCQKYKLLISEEHKYRIAWYRTLTEGCACICYATLISDKPLPDWGLCLHLLYNTCLWQTTDWGLFASAMQHCPLTDHWLRAVFASAVQHLSLTNHWGGSTGKVWL